MTISWFGLPLTVIGHRGSGRGLVSAGHRVLVENSVASLVAACEEGVDGVEVDAVRCRDGALVMSHATVLADGTPIESLTAAEASRAGLDLLEDAFAQVPPAVGMIVEIKTVLGDIHLSHREGTADLVAQALLRERATHNSRPLLTYGFDPSAATVLRKALGDADVTVGVIAEGGTDLAMMTHAAVRLGSQVVVGHTTTFLGDRVTEQLLPYTLAQVVEVGHGKGVKYACWCPDLDQTRQLLAAGVDAVCIDEVPSSILGVRSLGCTESVSA